MSCRFDVQVTSELDFVVHLDAQESSNYAQCAGVPVRLALTTYAVHAIARTLRAEEETLARVFGDVGARCEAGDHYVHVMCLMHWAAITAVVTDVGRRNNDAALNLVGVLLFREVCTNGGLDHREVENLLVSRYLPAAGRDWW